MEIDVDGFEPEELNVEVDKMNTMTVSARHEKNDNGNFVSRKFNRQYQVCEGTKPMKYRLI